MTENQFKTTLAHQPAVRAVIFDADGVTVNPPENFSAIYARRIGVDPADFKPFFGGPFKMALTGKVDLESVIKQEPVWQWGDKSHDDFKGLMHDWCESEHYPNESLIQYIRAMSARGLATYLATNQEHNRLDFLKKEMFPGVFSGGFLASCEVGYTKDQPEFWSYALEVIRTQIPDVSPEEVVYLDDDQRFVDVASSVGIRAMIYRDVDQVRELVEREE
jgi:FMN phosphatase YigB (HAD superfamily)